jgi:hypothetical protein
VIHAGNSKINNTEKMKLYLIRIFLIITLASNIGCGQNSKLSDDDKKWVSELNLDEELVIKLRTYTDSSFRKASGHIEAEFGFKDSTNYQKFLQKNIQGISFNASEDMAFKLTRNLAADFNEKGYFIYISEMNFGYSPDEITILKTNDVFDLLRFEGTNGVNYDIFCEDIITKLNLWDEKYGLEIFAVGFDVIQAHYKKSPSNLDEHATELYDFCPDIVEQGAGTIDELKLVIARTKQLYLWWD